MTQGKSRPKSFLSTLGVLVLILSKGFKKPQAGDMGSVWFPALEDDIQQLNDHTHNGTDSQLLSGGSITNQVVAIAAVDWVAFGPGYRFLLSLPSGYTYDGSHKEVRINGGAQDGAIVVPTIEKVSNTTMYVYCNDNTISFNVSFK